MNGDFTAFVEARLNGKTMSLMVGVLIDTGNREGETWSIDAI